MSDSATTTKGKLYIGLAKWLGTVAMIVYGGVTVFGPMNTQEMLTETVNGVRVTHQVATGSQVRINGVRHYFTDTIPLTLTGGLAKYDLASIDPADYFTGSGVLTTASVMWIKAPKVVTTDLGFATALNTATGAAALVPNHDNKSSATGALIWFGTGGVRWNGGHRLKLGSMTAVTTSASGYLLISGYEDLSE